MNRVAALNTFYKVLLVLTFISLATDSVAQTGRWDDRFDALGVNGVIYAVVAAESDVYVGGTFSKAGNVDANNVARWDGTSWHALGSGITSDATAAAVFDLALGPNGQIAAGGQFNRANNGIVNSIALWDGVNWSRLQSAGQIGVNNTVRAIAFHNNELFVGGLFSSAGSLPVNGMAKWNGVSWERVREANGVDGVTGGSIHAMASSKELLYVGGDFRTVGIRPANTIAAWDESNKVWSTFQNGMDGPVYAVAIDSNADLFAAGDFGNAGGIAANNVAKWDGSSWSSLGSGPNGVDGAVNALALGPEGLILGGEFSKAGTTRVNAVAAWNGSAWWSFGTGITGRVFDVVGGPLNTLYVAGQFTEAGNIASHNFAAWNRSGLTSVESPTPQSNSSPFLRSYPNPFNPTTTVHYELPKGTHVILKIHNLLGEEIATLVNERQTAGVKEVVWNGTNGEGERAASGIYIYRIQTGSFVESQKMLLVR